ncbi:MAG: peptidyl-prolyl cis-trans isomerase [Planctomycetota bacterium]
MGGRRRWPVTWATAVGFVVAFAGTVAAQGGMAAVVEGELITRYQLERELAIRMIELGRQYPTQSLDAQKAEIRAQVLDELILRRLLLQRCDAEQIEAGPKDIERFLDQQVERARREGETVKDRHEFLRRGAEATGQTEEELTAFFRDQIRIARLYHTRVFKDSFVSPEELRSFYDQHQAKFATAPRHVFRMILVFRNNPDLETIVSRIEEELAAGKSFVDVLGQYSEGLKARDGGLYDLADEELDSYQLPIPTVVRGLEPGQVSPRVISPGAVHYILLESRTPRKQLAFEEAQERIQERILQERRSLQQQAFERELREHASIERLLQD